MEKQEIVILDINQNDSKFSCTPSIERALLQAELEKVCLNDTIESVKTLKPNCDKLDYALAASSGALCGILDIFLVGKPGESPLGNITDKWFEHKTCDFARLCGWKGGNSKSAISYLERHFKVPYDQRGCGDAASFIFELNPSNHHFKSLSHNPSLLGLFFSILDQFSNTSHFISNGQLIELIEADNGFELRGNSVPTKLWSAFVNWFAHLMSDMNGSSGGTGRGMGIPSPLWTWVNDIVAIKSMLKIPISSFDKNVCELALKIFEEGFDFRFQGTQTIPVLINELIVRLFYSIRRLVKYYGETDNESRTFINIWSSCEPFSNPTVKRMLTVAHGTFCLVDAADATVRGFVSGGGNFNPREFFLRLNVAGVGRFTICLYGEGKRAINIHQAEKKSELARKELCLLEDYIQGLKILRERYDDDEYLSFVDDLQYGEYETALTKTASLAELRGVPPKKVLKTKKDIDDYFNNTKETIMAKEKTELQIAKETVESLINKANCHITDMTPYAYALYNILDIIDSQFAKIKNVSDRDKEEFQRAKDLRSKWEKQVNEIQSQYSQSQKINVGSGIAGASLGVGIVTLGPTAAMGIASTFGVASTGTAISTLSGAAATKAALAWLGGGALSTGGGGIIAGKALIATAGPVGWTIAGVALIGSGLMFLKTKSDKSKLESLFLQISKRDQYSYQKAIADIEERNKKIIQAIDSLKIAILEIAEFGLDYNKMTEKQQVTLGSYVNSMFASAELLVTPIAGFQQKYTEDDAEYYFISKDESLNREYYLKHKDLIIYMTNLLYNIETSDTERKLLMKSFAVNKDFLEQMSISKDNITLELFNLVDRMLKFAYTYKKM